MNNQRPSNATQRTVVELSDAQKRELTKRVIALLRKDIERTRERQGSMG